MRFPAFLAAAFLWQSALLVNIGAPAAPEHLRYQRQIIPLPGASGLSCVSLDNNVLAHTASAAHNDLRLYRGEPDSPAQAEVPYLLTESGPEPVPDTQAAVEHVARAPDGLRFDLRMPQRPYSEVSLSLNLHDFIGTVKVFAESHGHEQKMGTFGIYDLTGARLGRWTALQLAETETPLLHVVLSLRTPSGAPLSAISPAMLEGATVPPSRERQTLYTPVATTSAIVRRDGMSVGALRVPAHVPVERVSFDLVPGFSSNFYREVIVSARPDRQDLAETEILDAGAIEHVRIPSGDPALNPIDTSELSVDATLGATLASSARVRVSVRNGALPPLPIRRITLEMRERRVCFLAAPGARYTLRYGDPGLGPPVYDTAGLLSTAEPPTTATLGPEQRNPDWRPRQDQRPFFTRHPELFWVLVLICGGMMGGSGLHFVQHREGHTRA